MRADNRGSAPRDFPWHDAIRSELESWMPERLPRRFRARSRRPLAPWWRLATATTVLLIAVVAGYLLAPAHSPEPIGVRLRLGPTVRVTPSGDGPAPALATSAPATPSPTGVPEATPARPAGPQPAARPTPAPGAPPTLAVPTPTPAAPSTPAGRPTPAAPSPSPPAVCLPILPLCV